MILENKSLKVKVPKVVFKVETSGLELFEIRHFLILKAILFFYLLYTISHKHVFKHKKDKTTRRAVLKFCHLGRGRVAERVNFPFIEWEKSLGGRICQRKNYKDF